ncbi:MAG: Alcohol dehydrogenase, zinc-binding domain protein [Rhizobium sp.]|nr:Alcohol dehydrogenase, zinc-binding domain protein [Rhizobium sp.]
MKALRFHARNDLRIDDVDPPVPPGDDEVVVKVLQSGICGTDLHEYKAGPILVPTTPHPFTGAVAPQILGHEFSARVTAVGRQVSDVKVGDRVAIIPHLNKPGDYFTRRNLGHISPATGLVGLSWQWGGMGEHAMLPSQNVVKLPDKVSDEQGAIAEPASVALNAIDQAGVFPGSTVLVTGAGPIGALVALAAVYAGAASVYVFEPNAARRARLADFKGVTIHNGTRDELLDILSRETEGGMGVDICIECAGHQDALTLCLDAVKRTGTIAQVGLFVKTPMLDMFKVSEKAVRIMGCWGFPITSGPRVIAMIASGRFPVEKIITGRVALDDAIKGGFDELGKPGGDHLKILIGIGQ